MTRTGPVHAPMVLRSRYQTARLPTSPGGNFHEGLPGLDVFEYEFEP